MRAAIAEQKISARKFYAALDQDENAAERYARARAAGLDRMADDTLRIADDPELEPNDKRIRVDTRKWLLSKLAPKKYGEKLDLEHSGSVGLKVTRADESVL